MASQDEGLVAVIRRLKARDDSQRALQSRALDIAETLLQARWVVLAGTATSVPMTFLVILLFWLTITFASFGLFSPWNTTVLTVLCVCALSVASAIFLCWRWTRHLMACSGSPPIRGATHTRV